MKLTQTQTQLEISNSGITNIIFGVILAIGGVAVAAIPFVVKNGAKPQPAWISLIGLGLIAIGALILFTARGERFTLNKGGNIDVNIHRLIGGATTSQSIPLANVVAVRLVTTINTSASSNQNGPSGRHSILSLVINNNDLLNLAQDSSNGGIEVNGMNVSGLWAKAPLSKEAKQISEFLGVPLQADDSSSLAGTVKSIVGAATEAFQEHQTPNTVTPTTPTPTPLAPTINMTPPTNLPPTTPNN